MPIPPFIPGYPPDGSSLGQTKSTIRNNLDGTFQTLNVDHINNNGDPGSKPAGYHTIIHEVPQTTVTTVSGYNQVFSGVPGALVVNGTTTPAIPPTDQQLYSLTGGGILSQLTGHNATSSGYQWIGGILIQWGNASATFVPVDFPVAFPHAVFSMVVTGSSSLYLGGFVVSSLTQTAFTVTRTDGSGATGYYYIAIGN